VRKSGARKKRVILAGPGRGKKRRKDGTRGETTTLSPGRKKSLSLRGKKRKKRKEKKKGDLPSPTLREKGGIRNPLFPVEKKKKKEGNKKVFYRSPSRVKRGD